MLRIRFQAISANTKSEKKMFNDSQCDLFDFDTLVKVINFKFLTAKGQMETSYPVGTHK